MLGAFFAEEVVEAIPPFSVPMRGSTKSKTSKAAANELRTIKATTTLIRDTDKLSMAMTSLRYMVLFASEVVRNSDFLSLRSGGGESVSSTSRNQFH